MGGRYLVECYWPGVTHPALTEAVTRVRAAARGLRAAGREITFLGGELMPGDEVAFFKFAAGSAACVAEAATAARLPFSRVLDSIDLAADGDDGANGSSRCH